ncbi:hypothetical protein D3C81_677310 [compost metagenome]
MAGLDLDRYDNDMSTHRHLPHIRADQHGGTRCRVRGTPSFFVNGTVQDVTFGMERLQRAIDTALAA